MRTIDGFRLRKLGNEYILVVNLLLRRLHLLQPAIYFYKKELCFYLPVYPWVDFLTSLNFNLLPQKWE